MIDLPLIGRTLKAWRQLAGFTQEQAAVWAGMAVLQLQRVERGEYTLRIDKLMELACIYGRDWREVTSTEGWTKLEPPRFRLFHHPTATVSAELREEIDTTLARWKGQK